MFNKYKGKVMTVEVKGMDFKSRPDDFAAITNRIDATLYGLFDDYLPTSPSNQ